MVVEVVVVVVEVGVVVAEEVVVVAEVEMVVVVRRYMLELICPSFQKADKLLNQVHSRRIHYHSGRKPLYQWDILYFPFVCRNAHDQNYICVVLHRLLHPRKKDNINGTLP